MSRVPVPATGPAGRASRAWRRGGGARLVLLGPALTWWAVLLALPLLLLVVASFLQRGAFGGLVFSPTLDNYRRLVDPLYLGVLSYSVRIAAGVTVLALLLGYPTAYFIATRSPRWRLPLLVLVVLPFWTNFLIRTYAWIVLLNRQGVVNRLLERLELVGEPLTLLNNEFAVVVGLLYAYLPLMILPIYAAIERLDPRLREASADLGMTPARTFLSVTLPLTVPGVVAGCLFVFVPTLGNYVVPELLGGGRRAMIGNLIEQQFLSAGDWPFGSTLALAVMALTLVLLVVQGVVVSREKAR